MVFSEMYDGSPVQGAILARVRRCRHNSFKQYLWRNVLVVHGAVMFNVLLYLL
jgi:hypothetical protein